MNIDLHIHSTASDGTYTPDEIIEIADAKGLAAISITDHDTLEGSRRAIEIIAKKLTLKLGFIPGIEVSANPPREYPCRGSFHLLGYGFNMDDPALNRAIATFQKARKDRNPAIIKKLNALGFDLSQEELETQYGTSQLGRVHIARLMINKGYAMSIDHAFKAWLGKGRPGFVEKYRAPCHEAIRVIAEAGGIPVLAHPKLIEPVESTPVETLVAMLKDMGLQGIEVYYPEHDTALTLEYQKLARKFGLMMTGGTDFHGRVKPDVMIGTGKGDFSVPYSVYEKLIERAA